MLLCNRPERMIRVRISVGCVSKTSSSSMPSSSRIRSPGLTALGRSLYWIGTRPGSPRMGSVVNINSSPCTSGTPPSRILPVRSLGPCRSARMAIGFCSSSETVRTRSIVSAWYSWVPWLMLRRAMFMPAAAIRRRTGNSRLEGPMVQTILTRNMAQKFPCLAGDCFSASYHIRQHSGIGLPPAAQLAPSPALAVFRRRSLPQKACARQPHSGHAHRRIPPPTYPAVCPVLPARGAS